MRCKYVKQKLDRYIQGDLPGPISKKIEQHLHKCSGCADALIRTGKLDELFEDVSSAPVPEDFRERVMQRVRQRQQISQTKGPAVIKLWNRVEGTVLKKSAAAAILVIGLSAGLYMGLQTAQTSYQKQALGRSIKQSEIVSTYKVDYLTEVPQDSLSGTFVRMVGSSKEY